MFQVTSLLEALEGYILLNLRFEDRLINAHRS